MREIKHKGKATMTTDDLDEIDISHNNGWVVGNLAMFGNTPYIVGDLIEVEEEYTIHEWWVEVYPKSVGQYTGLKDKNNVEIYEGDNVCLEVPERTHLTQGNGWTDVDTVEGFSIKGTVKFIYNCWFLEEQHNKGCPLDFEEEQTLEVIGNSFDQSYSLDK